MEGYYQVYIKNIKRGALIASLKMEGIAKWGGGLISQGSVYYALTVDHTTR